MTSSHWPHQNVGSSSGSSIKKYYFLMGTSSRKLTIRNSLWNFRSILLRLLFVLTLLLMFAWMFLSLYSLYFASLMAKLHTQFNNFASSFSANSPSMTTMNFTLKFSNLERQYSMEVPKASSKASCNGKRVLMLVLIMSRRDTEWKRQGIRQSWARDAPPGVLIRFVIGDRTPDEQNSTHVDSLLEKEQSKFDDLIRYSIADGYENLHFKMGAAFQWQLKFCPQAEFVMKTDDDTVVDLPRWQFWTETKFRKDLELNKATFFGLVLSNTGPIRELGHKWYVPVEHFAGDRYPRYMQGATYFGTGEAIRTVMAHTAEEIGFNMDDIVYTGTLADRANVSRIHYGHIHFRGGNQLVPDEPCDQGKPLVFAIFRSFQKAEDFTAEYKKLHELKCK